MTHKNSRQFETIIKKEKKRRQIQNVSPIIIIIILIGHYLFLVIVVEQWVQCTVQWKGHMKETLGTEYRNQQSRSGYLATNCLGQGNGHW